MILKVPPTPWEDAGCWKATEANKSSLLCTELIIPWESSAQSGRSQQAISQPNASWFLWQRKSFLPPCDVLATETNTYCPPLLKSQIQVFQQCQLSVRDSKLGLWLSKLDLVPATKKGTDTLLKPASALQDVNCQSHSEYFKVVLWNQTVLLTVGVLVSDSYVVFPSFSLLLFSLSVLPHGDILFMIY